jgi:tetratricopeptide (TPR) repeat protein
MLTRFSMQMGLNSPSRDLWVRLPTVFSGILAIPLLFVLGRVFLGKEQAIVASLLITVSAFHIHYSQEARYYALLTSVVILCIIFFWKALSTSKWPWWVGFFLASLAALYTHLFAVFILVACGLFLLSLVVTRAIRDGGGLGENQAIRHLLPFSLGGLVLILAYIPIYPYVLQLWQSPVGVGSASSTSIQLSLSFILGLVADFTMSDGIGLGLFIALFLLGSAFMARRATPQWWFSILIFTVPIISLWIIQPKHYFHAKYLIFMFPLFLLTIAEGVVGIARAVPRPAIPALWRRVPVVASLLLLSLVLINGFAIQELYAEQIEDWRSAAIYLQEHVQPGDVIVCDGQNFGRGRDARRAEVGLGHYLDPDSQGIKVIREFRSVEHVMPISEQQGRIWLVMWHLRPLETEAIASSWTPIPFEQITVFQPSASSSDPILPQLERSLRALLAIQPLEEGRFDLHLALVKLYARLGDTARARDEMDRALAVKPDDPLAEEHLAEAYETYRAALPAEAQQLAEQGQLLLEQGDNQAAIEALRQAISLDSSQRLYYRLLGDALGREGRWEEAIEAYEQALDVSPEFGDTAWFLMRLGDAYHQAGYDDKARRAYQRVLEIEPGHEQARERLQWLSP